MHDTHFTQRRRQVRIGGVTIIYDGKEYSAEPIDISIPLRFDGPQPNAYGVERASARACEAGDIAGDTRRGGSCNFEQITLIPHCNGTHTECVGHITHERIALVDCLKDAFIPTALISVGPEESSGDLLITKDAIVGALGGLEEFAGLVIRTLPNDGGKMERAYGGGQLPAYFTGEAMEFIVELGVRHLLVDVPSIDRMFDEGRLANHRIFWNVEVGKFDTLPDTRVDATITEMIYVPDEVEDGEYLLNLQIAPFVLDAAPSRPVLFRRR